MSCPFRAPIGPRSRSTVRAWVTRCERDLSFLGKNEGEKLIVLFFLDNLNSRLAVAKVRTRKIFRNRISTAQRLMCHSDILRCIYVTVLVSFNVIAGFCNAREFRIRWTRDEKSRDATSDSGYTVMFNSDDCTPERIHPRATPAQLTRAMRRVPPLTNSRFQRKRIFDRGMKFHKCK